MTPPGGGHYSISWFVASPDGRRVAYGLAASGSEQDVLQVLDVETGHSLPDEIDRMEAGYTDPSGCPTAAASTTAGAASSRRRPSTEGYKLTRSYLHRLGTPADRDELAFAKDLWPNVIMTRRTSPASCWSRARRTRSARSSTGLEPADPVRGAARQVC